MSADWISALFDRALDIFAKVVPGFILLGASTYAFAWPEEATVDTLEKLPAGAWIAVFAVAWITGFAVQSFGESMRLIRYYPCKFETDAEWYEISVKFLQRTQDKQHLKAIERLSLIMEVCGNTYVAMLASILLILFMHLLILFVHCTKPEYAITCNINLILPGTVYLLLMCFLARMHFVHVKRQYEYMKAVMTLL